LVFTAAKLQKKRENVKRNRSFFSTSRGQRYWQMDAQLRRLRHSGVGKAKADKILTNGKKREKKRLQKPFTDGLTICCPAAYREGLLRARSPVALSQKVSFAAKGFARPAKGFSSSGRGASILSARGFSSSCNGASALLAMEPALFLC